MGAGVDPMAAEPSLGRDELRSGGCLPTFTGVFKILNIYAMEYIWVCILYYRYTGRDTGIQYIGVRECLCIVELDGFHL